MRIECSNCYQTYTVSDQRMPREKRIAFPCPVCNATIKLDLRTNRPEGGVSDSTETGDALKIKILGAVTGILPYTQTLEKAHRLISDRQTSIDELVAIVEVDPAMALRVMRLANSSYYARGRTIRSIRDAALLLDTEALKELLSVMGGEGLQANLLLGYRTEAGFAWQHALAVAFGARLMAQELHPRLAGEAYVAGLLHDIGKYLLDEHVAARETVFDQVMDNGGVTRTEAELEIFGFDHGEIAYLLCKKIGLPESLCTAIRFHHRPELAEGEKLPAIVFAADSLSRDIALGGGSGMRASDAYRRWLPGIAATRYQEIGARVTDRVNQVTGSISL